jgi:hypothetical protein
MRLSRRKGLANPFCHRPQGREALVEQRELRRRAHATGPVLPLPAAVKASGMVQVGMDEELSSLT